MRKIGFIALIALAIVASASCHRRPLHDMEERVMLKVVIDVDTVCNVGRNIYNDKLAKPNTNTDMLRMFFYNSADHSYAGETLLSDKSYDEAGHQVFTSYLNIPSGTFDFVVYNFDTPNTLIKNTNNEGTIEAYTQQVGNIALEHDYTHYDLSLTEQNAVRCPDPEKARQMEQLIASVKAEGDTIGGVITCIIKGCPVGLGEPEFGKLHATLGAAMLSINAVKGFEYGEGFSGVSERGSQQNDVFSSHDGHITTESNHSGGIQGGISNGQDIYFRVAFKPVATILQEQQTVDDEGRVTTLNVRGRHDPCVLPRAVPVVEAMAAMTILDAVLMQKTTVTDRI